MDLRMRLDAVHYWFAGEPVYVPTVLPMPYPPASYSILWPFLGWLDFAPARWLWTLTLLGSLIWLIAIAVRETGARSTPERLFLSTFVPATYAVCITVGNGQLGVHVLPLLLWAILRLRGGERGWSGDLTIAVPFALALVKPSLAAPFFWILLLNRRGWRPAVLVVAMYSGLTVLAASFRPEGVMDLLRLWVSQSESTALNARYGYANLHQWMKALGLEAWASQGSLIALFLLGTWIWRHRHRPLWPLLGVTAIFARLWTYHALYDDLLMLIPMMALVWLIREGSQPFGATAAASVLLVVGCFSALAPARLLGGAPPLALAFRTAQALTWTAMLVLLAATAARLPDEPPAPLDGNRGSGAA